MRTFSLGLIIFFTLLVLVMMFAIGRPEPVAQTVLLLFTAL